MARLDQNALRRVGLSDFAPAHGPVLSHLRTPASVRAGCMASRCLVFACCSAAFFGIRRTGTGANGLSGGLAGPPISPLFRSAMVLLLLAAPGRGFSFDFLHVLGIPGDVRG